VLNLTRNTVKLVQRIHKHRDNVRALVNQFRGKANAANTNAQATTVQPAGPLPSNAGANFVRPAPTN
jgi:hypothetical protein